jgi:hypothetical protein
MKYVEYIKVMFFHERTLHSMVRYHNACACHQNNLQSH